MVLKPEAWPEWLGEQRVIQTRAGHDRTRCRDTDNVLAAVEQRSRPGAPHGLKRVDPQQPVRHCQENGLLDRRGSA